jgi:probable rRNA maturation factor
VIIHIIDRQSDLEISPTAVKKIVESVIKGEKQKCDEVSIYFVDTAEICDLHEQFFDDPSTTDCISFPMDEDEEDFGHRILGEIFVCPETAVKYASEHVSTTAPEEVTLYVIHGLLHLMGYRDLEEDDISMMRKAETRHIKRLQKLGITHLCVNI